MLTSAITPSTSSGQASGHALVRTAGGEYTAASVEANPNLAAGLIKLKDGNYAVPIVRAADQASGFDALAALRLGGA